MTGDLISREAALEIIMKYCPDDDGSCSKADADLREMLDEIENIPAVDAAPVVHARWVDPCINKYGHPCHHCSACRFKASQKDRNYCPNCGAKMDEEAGNAQE